MSDLTRFPEKQLGWKKVTELRYCEEGDEVKETWGVSPSVSEKVTWPWRGSVKVVTMTWLVFSLVEGVAVNSPISEPSLSIADLGEGGTQ